MRESINSLKQTARVSGLLYLVMALGGLWGSMYVPAELMVNGDFDATAQNILSNELLFRSAIAGNLLCAISSLFLALALDKLFKQVNQCQSKVLTGFVVLQIPVIFVIEACRITCLMILKGEAFTATGPSEAQSTAAGLLNLYTYGTITLEIFMGLWLLPFGMLICKSGFIPWVLGTLLIVAGAGCVIDGLIFILFPALRLYTQPLASMLYVIAALPIMFWLLIRGVRDHLSIPIVSESARSGYTMLRAKEYI